MAASGRWQGSEAVIVDMLANHLISSIVDVSADLMHTYLFDFLGASRQLTGDWLCIARHGRL